mmetsp:Transcript_45420/g.128156  ORF Transcript_45420/g.128156 Transcript_45420/m.128156 type:complete len:164 (-) Transcript_45420:719-1210(-)
MEEERILRLALQELQRRNDESNKRIETLEHDKQSAEDNVAKAKKDLQKYKKLAAVARDAEQRNRDLENQLFLHRTATTRPGRTPRAPPGRTRGTATSRGPSISSSHLSVAPRASPRSSNAPHVTPTCGTMSSSRVDIWCAAHVSPRMVLHVPSATHPSAAQHS